MKNMIYFFLSMTIFLNGCLNEPKKTLNAGNQSLYSVIVGWESPEKCYARELSGWSTLVMGSGRTGHVTAPIPDQVTFSWKTAMPGGKEYFENIDDFPEPNDDGTYPEVVLYPESLFQDHTTILKLTDKIPQPFQGEIYFTIKDSGDVVVRYIEFKRLDDDYKSYIPMDEYNILVVNTSSSHLYDFKAIGWPLNIFFSSLPTKAGYNDRLWPYTVPPKQTTLTWKTALEGGKEYYDNFKKIIAEPSDNPRLERYPADKFKEHQVEIEIDSDKIVEYGEGAQLIFYVYDNDHVEVEYRAKGE